MSSSSHGACTRIRTRTRGAPSSLLVLRDFSTAVVTSSAAFRSYDVAVFVQNMQSRDDRMTFAGTADVFGSGRPTSERVPTRTVRVAAGGICHRGRAAALLALIACQRRSCCFVSLDAPCACDTLLVATCIRIRLLEWPPGSRCRKSRKRQVRASPLLTHALTPPPPPPPFTHRLHATAIAISIIMACSVAFAVSQARRVPRYRSGASPRRANSEVYYNQAEGRGGHCQV